MRREGLCQIDQVEHGRIAGELASCWGNSEFETPFPHVPVVFATTRHDEGWRRFDAMPLMNDAAGRALHFLEMESEEHTRLYRNGVEWVTARDAYAGLLVGMHWTGIYRGRWFSAGARGRMERGPEDARALDDIVTEEERRWVGAREEAWSTVSPQEPRAVFEARLWHNFELLQLWDLLSLYFCVMPPEPPEAGVTPTPWGPQLSALEHTPMPVTLPTINTGLLGRRAALSASVIDLGVVTVDPWPFAVPEFGLAVEQSGAVTRPVEWIVRQSPATGQGGFQPA